MTARPNVAVVGSGVAGLTAAYLLQRRYDVTLFEADSRLGGHAHTHDVRTPAGSSLALDSGFLVCNRSTYPLLMKLFDELKVSLQPAPMGMSIRCGGCGIEYGGGRGLRGLFADRGLAARPQYWRMLAEIMRFYRQARRYLDGGATELTVGQWIAAHTYSPWFTQHFMIPLVAAVWSTGSGRTLEFPAHYLFRFLDNHGMLSATGSLPWLTVSGGSRTYVERIAAQLHAVRAATPVRAVTRHDDGIEVHTAPNGPSRFDRVVLATHADTTLSLLSDPSPDEKDVLSGFTYSSNEAVIHRDQRLLPVHPAARVSWNYYVADCQTAWPNAAVTYDITRLQTLRGPERYLVTLNGTDQIRPELVESIVTYEHPLYTARSVAAQEALPSLNQGRTAFAGAYHGWGFHEDGCRAGVAAAASFGVTW